MLFTGSNSIFNFQGRSIYVWSLFIVLIKDINKRSVRITSKVDQYQDPWHL